MSHGPGLAQATLCLKQLSKMPDGDLLDLSNSVGKFFWRNLHQASVGQRLSNAMTPVFIGHNSVPQFHILTDAKGLAPSGLLLGRLKPQIDVCQVLVEFSPKSLFAIPRIDATLCHRNQSLFPGFAFFL